QAAYSAPLRARLGHANLLRRASRLQLLERQVEFRPFRPLRAFSLFVPPIRGTAIPNVRFLLPSGLVENQRGPGEVRTGKALTDGALLLKVSLKVLNRLGLLARAKIHQSRGLRDAADFVFLERGEDVPEPGRVHRPGLKRTG